MGKSRYTDLLETLTKAAEAHPKSCVVVDAGTGELIDSGTNAGNVYRRVSRSLQPGQVPVVFQKPKQGEILIF